MVCVSNRKVGCAFYLKPVLVVSVIVTGSQCIIYHSYWLKFLQQVKSFVVINVFYNNNNNTNNVFLFNLLSTKIYIS